MYLKDSRILGYLGGIRPDDVPYLRLGEYPAIEALAFAVLEILEYTDGVAALEEIRRLEALYARPW